MTEISISDNLASYLEHRIKYTEFESIDSYVEYILVEVTENLNEVDDEVLVEKNEVERQLEALGYLNE